MNHPERGVKEPDTGTNCLAHPEVGVGFLADVQAGLSRPQKELPCKYFYDAEGSRLFDAICELPEYYPTRTELAITRSHAAEMAERIGPGCVIIEYGSGSSTKTRALLRHLGRPTTYIPVDISGDHLHQSAQALGKAFPDITVKPVVADFTRPFPLPPLSRPQARRVVYFPGSTIGNFAPAEALALLRGIATLCGPGGGLLIGVDLKKDPVILNAAYNDAAGVTAAFNLNLLVRINRELGADFNLNYFRHRAHFNPELGRIEMHLVSTKDQIVSVSDQSYRFRNGETIHTENSHKYTVGEFAALAGRAGFVSEAAWTDARSYFGVQFYRLPG